MKGMDILCASEAATPTRLTMEQPSSSSSSSSSSFSSSSNVMIGGSSPAIDRHNPIISDCRRSTATPLPPLTLNKKLPPKQNKEAARKSSQNKETARKSWSCTKPGAFISPPGSARYLLSEKVLFDDIDADTSKSKGVASSAAVDQVVVLRVSLHCRGCERKMRKHLSRMEGVRSFNIDFAAKKVTVSGKVTPLEVLSSISKVKNAQLWGPAIADFKGAAAAAAWATDI